MSTKTLLFLLALALLVLDYSMKHPPTPLTEAEKAELTAEFQKNTEYLFFPNGETVRTAIFKTPKDKPVFWIYKERSVRRSGNYKVVENRIYPQLRIEFGDTLRERYNKRKAEQVSTE